MKRREFISLLGGVAATWPLKARAQQAARPLRRIGILSGFAEDPLVESELLRPLSQLNWDNGRNIQIDLRWGAGNIDRIRIMSKELVASQPEIMITVGTTATLAVQRETRTIPIVFLIVADPVGAGIVDNLARPGGNTTGFGNPEGAFGGKLYIRQKNPAGRQTPPP
jgi:putative tryptophan/tyrosine transport system substrate-binding protein